MRAARRVDFSQFIDFSGLLRITFPKDGGQLAWIQIVLSTNSLAQERLWCQCDGGVRDLNFLLEEDW
jgi:hypothetical protein